MMWMAKGPPWTREGRGSEVPGERRGRGPLIKRWIGFAQRRAARMRREEPREAAEIITLPWAQTFGKPSFRQDLSGDGQSLPGGAIVLVTRR